MKYFVFLSEKKNLQLDCLRARMTETGHNLLNDQIEGFSSSPAASADPDFQRRHSPRLGKKSNKEIAFLASEKNESRIKDEFKNVK